MRQQSPQLSLSKGPATCLSSRLSQESAVADSFHWRSVFSCNRFIRQGSRASSKAPRGPRQSGLAEDATGRSGKSLRRPSSHLTIGFIGRLEKDPLMTLS
jgi:hypothetical protein